MEGCQNHRRAACRSVCFAPLNSTDGAYNSSKVKSNLATIEAFSRHLIIFPDSVESARLFGRIKADLKRQGKPIEDFDVLVASIAIANNCTLVTHNINHFSRIAGLPVEDWLTSVDVC